jgi:hypothetical protein
MSFIEQLSGSLEVRLRQLEREIASLEAARSELVRSDASAGATRLPIAGNGGPPVAPARRARARRRSRVSDAEIDAAIETLLRDVPDGTSAITLTKRTGAPYARVRERLATMERADHVRRSGAKRTSLWRLVSEDELIAERAAELERLSRSSG